MWYFGMLLVEGEDFVIYGDCVYLCMIEGFKCVDVLWW